ncbi:MAG TPA: M1 family metallopeptidase [Thermoanaerobaculia bacterium]|nr:M1 family metallopeptidase [Thermoanaerobaculia bacterium]
MSSRLPLALALCALPLAGTASNAAPAVERPELRLPAVARPTAMEVELTIRPDREEFQGRVGIDLELKEPTALLWLNASRLEIATARLVREGQETPASVVPGGEEFVGFDFGAPVTAGPARLEIDYRGRLDEIETDGLFRQRVDDDWYVFSQFESTSARRAFPCFDEPSYRSPWRLTLHVPADLVAVANTRIAEETPASEGLKTVRFEPTLPIPSYLVALGVGPFEIVPAGTWGRARTPVRIVVPRGRGAGAAYAAEVTGELLARLEEYFDLPYAFGKLDNLAIPHTVSFGAMEHPGLVTYSERYLLVDPEHGTLRSRRAYASVAAHENAHQWFGNYVTLAWWDDTWLNEGFADWISDKVIAAWRPDWWGPADRVDRRFSALRADSLSSSQPVRRPIRVQDDIEAAFDGISYAKGASLLEMFEAWIGPESFRSSIRGYLRSHALGNATSDDFLAALGGEAEASAFASFLDQPGAPVLEFEAECPEDRPAKLHLKQHRYVPLGSPVGRDQTWKVPVTARIGAGERSAVVRRMLDAPTASVELPFCPEWVAGNAGGIGYYLSDYPDGQLGKLAGLGDLLSEGEQIALLGDAAMLLAAGEVAPAEALGLLPGAAGSPHRQVVESAVTIAASVDAHLVEPALRPNYERFLATLFGERTRQLGLSPVPGEANDDTLLRGELVELMAEAGSDAAIAADARRLVDRWLEDRSAVAPEMVGVLSRAAASGGDAALFDGLLAAAKAERQPRVRRALLSALGSFRDPALLDRAFGVMTSGEFDLREGGAILFQASQDRINRPRVFEWIRANFDALLPELPQQTATYMAFTAAGFCGAERRAQVDEFFRPRLEKLPGGAIVLGQVLDIIDVCSARREAQQGAVSEFLGAY